MENSVSPASSSTGPIRVSQRQPQSCVECTRRKTKCDKRVPCSNCVKRGVPDRCRLEQVLPSKSLRSLSGIKRFRDETNASQARLEKKIKDLEALIRQTNPNALSTSAPSIENPEPAPALLSMPATPIASSPNVHEPSQEDGVGDDEAEAAGTLEFLALGRTRGKSPGGDGGEGFDMDYMEGEDDWIAPEWLAEGTRRLSSRSMRSMASLEPSLSPTCEMTHMDFLPPAIRETRPRGNILDQLPNNDVSRKLVLYDIENISWMHCCYHGPVFLSECDLFWSEIDGMDVEPNWSFVALLFAVLASAVYHMPKSELFILYPGFSTKEVVSRFFHGCLNALHKANWMQSHSLYAVQSVAILVSPANHLDKADLYFTMLGTAVRIAQALNLHRLGPDPERTTSEGSLSIAREVRKRTWYQLVIQDWFHVAFNGTNSIHAFQFNTPLPAHVKDDSKTSIYLPHHIPSPDQHIIYLSKMAAVVNKMYSRSVNFKPVPYDQILKADSEMNRVLAQTPDWMRDESIALDPSWPWWVQWQRQAFMISSSHKVIILHRPYLGRAFRGDKEYAKSKLACLFHADRILRLFDQCKLEPFRKTWTVLAHVIAASLVILVNAGHSDPQDTPQLLRPVETALEIFQTYSNSSDLAKKGIVVLQSLIRTVGSPTGPGGNSKGEEMAAVPGDVDFVGSAGKDLKRAIGILRRKRGSNSDSAIPIPVTRAISTPTPPSTSSKGGETLTSTSMSPEDEMMPTWRSDWVAPAPTSIPAFNLSFETSETADHGLSGLQTEDLFDTLFGLGDDSGMWDYRGLDLG